MHNYIIMPNHFHLLIEINDEICKYSIMDYIREIKSISTLKIYDNHDIDKKIFQRSFYDHIVRNKEEYNLIYEYIDSNPYKWQNDKYYCE